MIEKIISYYVESGKLLAMTSTYVFSENAYNDCELRYDFVQEIVLCLLEYKHPEKINLMYELNQLDFFIMRIIKTQATSSNCRWYRLFGRYEEAKSLSV